MIGRWNLQRYSFIPFRTDNILAAINAETPASAFTNELLIKEKAQ
jgi:hypothetical protein